MQLAKHAPIETDLVYFGIFSSHIQQNSSRVGKLLLARQVYPAPNQLVNEKHNSTSMEERRGTCCVVISPYSVHVRLVLPDNGTRELHSWSECPLLPVIHIAHRQGLKNT